MLGMDEEIRELLHSYMLTLQDIECKPGHECVLQDVVCVKAPCVPAPVCVRKYNNGSLLSYLRMSSASKLQH